MLSAVRQALVCIQSSTNLEKCLQVLRAPALEACSIREQKTIISNVRLSQCMSLDRLIAIQTTSNSQWLRTERVYFCPLSRSDERAEGGEEGRWALLHMVIKVSMLLRHTGSHIS